MDYKQERQLAKVKDVWFGIGDHGSITFAMDFDFGGAGQGLGHYGLEDPSGKFCGIKFIRRILDLFRVSTLDRIVGRTVYVIYLGGYEWGHLIDGIEIPEFDGGGRVIIKELFAEQGIEA